jgi:conjugative transfer signal peptidase TraF
MIVALRSVCVAVGALLLAVVTAHALGYLWVASESVPPGLWRKVSDPIERGSVIAFCPPDQTRFKAGRDAGFVPSGFCPGRLPRLVKPVAAVAGDVVEIGEEGFRVNGVLLPNTRPIEGRLAPLQPYSPGPRLVRDGEVWLVSTYNRRSWDSRYYGPVRITDLESAVRPVWTY